MEVSSDQRKVDLRLAESRGTPQPTAFARLLNPMEYAVAQGNPSTPLLGDPSENKVALSGRSASMLNMDWVVRNSVGEGGKMYPPPRGYVESYDTSEQARKDRLARHEEAKALEKQLEQERLRLAQGQMVKEEAYKKVVVILCRAWRREQSVRYQRFKLA